MMRRVWGIARSKKATSVLFSAPRKANGIPRLSSASRAARTRSALRPLTTTSTSSPGSETSQPALLHSSSCLKISSDSKRHQDNEAIEEERPQGPTSINDFLRTPTKADDPNILRRRLPLPSKHEFPTHRRRGCFEALQEAAKKLGYSSSILECRLAERSSRNKVCRLLWTPPGALHFTGAGIGRTRAAAIEAASLRLLSQLYSSGVIDSLRDANDVFLAKHADAKTAVYNFAAQQRSVPDFCSRPVSAETFTTFQSVLSIPGIGLKVASYGLTRLDAELYACIKYLRHVKAHVNDENMLLGAKAETRTELSTSTADEFLRFYKANYPNTALNIQAKQEGPQLWSATFSIRGSNPEIILARHEAHALQLATLTVAIRLLKEQPWAWDQYVAVRGNHFTRRPKVYGNSTPLSSTHINQLRSALVRAEVAGLGSDPVQLDPHTSTALQIPRFAQHQGIGIETMLDCSKINVEGTFQQPILASRQTYAKFDWGLLIGINASRIAELVRQHDVTIICAPAKSGKTTLIPQLLLDHKLSNFLKGPFRVLCVVKSEKLAISAAEWLAAQRKEPLGASVGYEIEEHANLPTSDTGTIVYTTTGLVVKHLLNKTPNFLDSFTHVFVDDAEYETPGVEMLLTLLRDLLIEKLSSNVRIPKTILAHSASTLSTPLKSYFSRDSSRNDISCGTLDLHATVQPTPRLFIDDLCKILARHYDSSELHSLRNDSVFMEVERNLAKSLGVETTTGIDQCLKLPISPHLTFKTIENVESFTSGEEVSPPLHLGALVLAHLVRISVPGTILVILPTRSHIKKMKNILTKESPLGVPFSKAANFDLITVDTSHAPPSHSFLREPSVAGRRKIIFASHRIDSLLAIRGLASVIDFGMETRHSSSEHSRGSRIMWSSRNEIKRRMQRADVSTARTHILLCTRSRAESLTLTTKSVVSRDLVSLSLLVLARPSNNSPTQFFRRAPIPPLQDLVDESSTLLAGINALQDDSFAITKLGGLLSLLRVDPALGRSIILGVVFRCYEPLQVIGAGMQSRNLFLHPGSQFRNPNRRFVSYSDHHAIYMAFDESRALTIAQGQRIIPFEIGSATIIFSQFYRIFRRARRMEKILKEASVIEASSQLPDDIGTTDLNRNATSSKLVAALLLSGAPRNIAVHTCRHRFRTASHEGCILSTDSVVHGARLASPGLIFFSRSTSSEDGTSLVLHQISTITPMAVLLFAADLKMTGSHTLEVAGWLRFHFPNLHPSALQTIVEFRGRLHAMINLVINGFGHKTSETNEQARQILTQALLKALSWNIGEFEVQAKPLDETVIGVVTGNATAEQSVCESMPADAKITTLKDVAVGIA